MRQTKIVATLGPSSSDRITELFEAGVDVFRLNFSHADEKTAESLVKKIRQCEKKFKRPIAILADLQGPKLRVGAIDETLVKQGDTVTFGEGGLALPHKEIFDAVKKGDDILIDDGRLRLEIISNNGKTLKTRAKNTHVLLPKKGVNLPGRILPLPALTTKDKKDLKTALKLDCDWIALSFVQTPDDVKKARKLIKNDAKLMVKIEKPSALDHLDEIIDLCDGVMLARGDLGVEIPIEHVPTTQKHVVHKVRAASKPIIVATQMLESMISSPFPTRAEASDVATAVYDGADAVMLSAETAAGEHPIRSVDMMHKICARTETDEIYDQFMEDTHPDTIGDPSDSIATAAGYVAEDIEAAAIVTYTMSGSTAYRMARQRPAVPILCLTPNISVARRLGLAYGVHSVHDPEIQGDFSGPVPHACEILQKQNLAEKGDRFVMTAGVPFGVAGTTNILRIAEVE